MVYDILQHINFGIKSFFNDEKIKEIFGMINFSKYSNNQNNNAVNTSKISCNGNFQGQNKSFKIIDIFYYKWEKKLNKISLNFNKNFSNLFKQKKTNYLNFFYYQLSVNKGEIANFLKVNIINFYYIFKSILLKSIILISLK